MKRLYSPTITKHPKGEHIERLHQIKLTTTIQRGRKQTKIKTSKEGDKENKRKNNLCIY